MNSRTFKPIHIILTTSPSLGRRFPCMCSRCTFRYYHRSMYNIVMYKLLIFPVAIYYYVNFKHTNDYVAKLVRPNKLSRNKNARHIFPRHFFTIAMIGIICLYMHFVFYISHTRSLSFKYIHYFRSYDIHSQKQKARARRGLQPRGFSLQTLFFDIASAIY